jgi:hypothetical protein
MTLAAQACSAAEILTTDEERDVRMRAPRDEVRGSEMVRFPDQRSAVSSPKNTRHVLILLFHMRVNENTPEICAPFICQVECAANPDSIDAYCGVGFSRSPRIESCWWVRFGGLAGVEI